MPKPEGFAAAKDHTIRGKENFPAGEPTGDRVFVVASQENQALIRDLRMSRISVTPASLRSAIAQLDKVIAQSEKAKEKLQDLLENSAKDGAGSSGQRAASRNSKTLKEAIVDVLKRSKRPLTPAELRDRVMAAGYKTRSTPRTFYITLFITAQKHPQVVKTKKGFRLRAGVAR